MFFQIGSLDHSVTKKHGENTVESRYKYTLSGVIIIYNYYYYVIITRYNTLQATNGCTYNEIQLY